MQLFRSKSCRSCAYGGKLSSGGPRDFTSSHPEQMCAKEVFALLAELRQIAPENAAELPSER